MIKDFIATLCLDPLGSKLCWFVVENNEGTLLVLIHLFSSYWQLYFGSILQSFYACLHVAMHFMDGFIILMVWWWPTNYPWLTLGFVSSTFYSLCILYFSNLSSVQFVRNLGSIVSLMVFMLTFSERTIANP